MTPATRLRPGFGLAVGLAAVGVAALALVPFRDHIGPAVPVLVLVLPVLIAAALGGRGAALVVSLAAVAAIDVLFLRPYQSFRIELSADIAAVVVFAAVAFTVGTLSAAQVERWLTSEERSRELAAVTEQLSKVEDERSHLVEEAGRAHRLEAAEEQRSALLRSVSHDLRTPLATIRAIASDLRAGTAYDDRTRAELLDTLTDEAERLDRLVANLLSLSRIEAAALRPDRQAVDVDELIHERLSRLARLFLQVRLVVDVPADLPLVDGDYSQLDQLITNLLENAARHAPPTSTVSITARPHRERMVEIRISDEGVGVAEPERIRIFEPFRRGTGSRSSGIGLAICKAVADAHAGSIHVERTPGGGATFVVRLPTRERPAW